MLRPRLTVSNLPTDLPDPPHDLPTTSNRSVEDEAHAAWSLFLFNWRLLAIISGVVLAWLLATQFYIQPSGYVIAFAVAGLYWRIGLYNARSPARWNPRLTYCLVAIAQLILALVTLSTLTYVATAIGFPLQDQRLLAWDRALGFDFRSYLDLINAYPRSLLILSPSYSSIAWQLIAMALVLPLAGCYRRIGQAISAFTFALLATTIVSIFVPAIGVYGALGISPVDHPFFEPQGYYDTLRDAPLLRAGTLRALDLWKLGGVLTFPSFHAATAALYIWAFWRLVWLRLVAILWNLAMIAATPLGGGHYLVDLLAGILVAILAIVAAKALGRLLPAAVPGSTEWVKTAVKATPDGDRVGSLPEPTAALIDQHQAQQDPRPRCAASC